jgi:putative Holliday junction resolvase
MAFLAIDYGEKRIGLAVGTIFPKGAGVVDGEQKMEKIVDDIAKICHEEEIEKIVVGLPIRSQGEEGRISLKARKLAAALIEKTGLPIYFEPEQYTSVLATEILKESGKNYSRASGKTDEMAAVLILEQFINKRGER